MAEVTESPAVAGVFVVRPQVFGDERGVFVETWRHEWVPGARPMVQGNRADRAAGCLVGLHYHLHQADYWYVPSGRAFVALCDLRAGSPTEGGVLTMEMDGETHLGLYIPPGVAHGFYAVTDMTITYLVDGYYDPADELGVAWDDPDLGVAWPLGDGEAPVLSDRDRSNPRRAELPEELVPRANA